MNVREKASHCRQRIREWTQELCRTIESLQWREAMLRGSVYNRLRRCGKSTCRCAQGEMHRDGVIAWKLEGRIQVRSVRSEQGEALEKAIGRWREFRRRRCQLQDRFKKLVREIDPLSRIRQQ